ncbi:hypothetical protein QKC54_gp0922 [Megavirus baoshan]|uniref:Uncharacterized protein n=1 Tax=Megavirus baoshan TaxID=2496520 RepID=A0A8K1T0T5_9VIRU|nr:hypothetical protein QKC54_gp0922 [Megavirus baoshan]UFX99743.1 hypothetical protein Mb0150 [Megavirus baoshan]
MSINNEYIEYDLENNGMSYDYRVIKCTLFRKFCEIVWVVCAIFVIILFIELMYKFFENN